MMKTMIVAVALTLLTCQHRRNDGGPDAITDTGRNQASKELVQRGRPTETQLKLGRFDTLSQTAPKSMELFQKNFLDSIVINGEAEFESDSSYVVDSIQTYQIDKNTIFYIKGIFLPSTVDFHYYGGYNGKDRYQEIYHLPLETSFNFTRYELSELSVRVFGERSDNGSEDDGEMLLFELTY